MKKTLKITFILIAAVLYTTSLYAQQPSNASDIAAQAAVVAAGNEAGSAAGGAFGPPDDEVETPGPETEAGPDDSGEEGEGESEE